MTPAYVSYPGTGYSGEHHYGVFVHGATPLGERLYRPVKMNLLTMGNAVPHLHTHVVPRYHDDPAPGAPIAWDAITTTSPTDPETLRRQAVAIRDALLDRE